jgi:hypothetical protein
MAKVFHPYNEARRRNNKNYDEKTYKKLGIALRLDEDAEIISALEEASQHGIKRRETISDWFYNGGNAKTANNSGHRIESDVMPILDSLTGVKPENKARAAEIAEKVQSDLRYKNIVRELTESEV